MPFQWLANLLDNELEGGTISGYVTNAKEDEQLRNYLETHGKEEVISSIQQKYNLIAILRNMYVEEDERGSGVGTQLLEEFLDDAMNREVDAVVLVADTGDESNEINLVEWYQGYDFEVFCGERHSYPVMVKELKE